MKCPRCQQDNPSEAKFCLECGTPFTRSNSDDPQLGSYTDLRRALSEAVDQQTATSGILRVISDSPSDVQPVLDTVVAHASRLCSARDAQIFRREGEQLRLVAHYGPIPTGPVGEFTMPLSRGTINGRAVLEQRRLQVSDLRAESTEYPEGQAISLKFGHRTVLTVPLLRHGVAIGTLSVRRAEVRPFTDAQARLLQTFADQAVMAIENVRLFTELQASNRELTTALDKQTATSDILRVISRSQTDVQPVFDAILASAVHLLGAYSGSLTQVAGDQIELVALTSTDDAGDAAVRARYPQRLQSEDPQAQALRDRAPLNFADAQIDPRLPEATRAYARARGWRSAVLVPMLRHGEAVGTISVTRRDPGGFTDDEIALLQTFADQAVIAIENVRLFNETKEALEQQTATAEILRVISQSPTDLRPVFKEVAQSAARLCQAQFCHVFRFDGALLHVAAHHGLSPEGVAALQSVYPAAPGRGSAAGRAILSGRIEQIPDINADADYRHSRIAAIMNYQSIAAVPMLRDGMPIGSIVAGRSNTGVFPERLVTLLQTFADQAVIAIENVRLFTELQEKNRALTQAHAQVSESLEQRTATAEILRVISSSPTDVLPVFETITDSAMRLFSAWAAAVFRYEGQLISMAAARGRLPGSAEAVMAHLQVPHVPTEERPEGRTALTRTIQHVVDVDNDMSWGPKYREDARARGFRSYVAVPMLRGDVVVGVITVSRQRVGGFAPAEISLLQTFADQAVIAIENVRLFNETKDALERQTATAEILRVISSSPTDVQPVFDAIVRSAARLCDGVFCNLFRFAGALVHLVAAHNLSPEALKFARRVFPAPLTRELTAGRAILDRGVTNIPDIEKDPELDPSFARAMGARSALTVPMFRDGQPIGTINVGRAEPGPFSSKQIELLQTFADQAVIAIENVRLFTELQEKNSALTEALDQQTATAEILRVISSSPTDLQPVFDTIVRSASRLCAADFGGLHLLDGDRITLEAHYNARAADYEAWQRIFPMPLGRATASGRAIHSRIPVHIADVQADPEFTAAVSSLEGHRTIVAVPMLREGIPIGTVVAWRREVRPFTDQQIEILQTFANQAVIAIENVRLFKELEARTQDLTRSVDELTALGEVSRVLSSTLDLETVLQTIVRRANDLAGTAGCTIWEYDEARGEFRLRASDFPDETDAAGLQSVDRVTTIRKGVGVTTQVMEQRQPVQVLDIAVGGAEENPIRRRLIEAGHHSLLGVPLLSEDEVIGVLAVTRKTPGEFEPDIVRLLSTFATQSALAIQNARLFLEIEDKSRQLEAASQHKSEFLANMSHELRTPLNAVIGFSEVLSERMFGELNEKQEEYLKDIHASGQHLLSLINDILDLSKIEAGRMELELVDFHLPTAIDNALTLVRERAGRRGIALHQATDEGLGQIRGDERKIKQVLLNLLSNAIKFTPDGGRIEVRAIPVDGSVEVSVTDTGVGIAPEDQEAIFEEFRQVGTADKKVEGTGLGLALSRRFVELHGGRIWVKSEVGVGSTFTFTFPVRTGA
jgi:GAF domain-containing protein